MDDEVPAGRAGDPTDLVRDVPTTTPEAAPSSRLEYALATDRHIIDLIAQRDRCEKTRAGLDRRLVKAAERIEGLAAENARLKTAESFLRRELDGERLQRGIVGIFATILTAIGGGFVSIYGGLARWFFASLLIIGCSYMLFNSIANLSRS